MEWNEMEFIKNKPQQLSDRKTDRQTDRQANRPSEQHSEVAAVTP